MEKLISTKYARLFCVIPFFFYFFTLSRTIGMGDTAILIDNMVRMSLYSQVNSHNLTNLIGHFFMWLPSDNLAFKANLFSAFWGAMSVCVFYFLAYGITKSVIPAIAAAMCMMVSHSLWWHSTIVECYAMNSFISLLIIYCYFQFEETREINWICRACFLSGFGLFNHVQMGFWLFATLVFVILHWDFFRNNRQGIVSSLCFLMLGLLPYIGILILDYFRSGAPFSKVLYMASGGEFQSMMFKFDPMRDIFDLFRLIFLQWPGFYLMFIAFGIYVIVKDRCSIKANAAIFTGFAINTVFFIQYHTWDKFAFLLPSFVILGFWGLFGVRRLYSELSRSRVGHLMFAGVFLFSISFPVYFYSRIPKWAAESGFWSRYYSTELTENTYDIVEYTANPCKNRWQGMQVFADLLFSKLPTGAVLIDDDGRSYFQLVYYFKKYYNVRPDVSVILYNSWGHDAKFWGEGIDNSNIIGFIQGVSKKKALFLISVKAPYAGVVTYLSQHNIRFDKFELDRTHWIYRVGEKEKTESAH